MKSLIKRLMFFVACIFAWQTSLCQVRINSTVDPGDSELNSAVKFISQYFDEFKERHIPDFRNYWSAADCKRYHYPDHLLFGVNTEIPTYVLGNPTILSVKPERGYVHIKTLFARADSVDKILVLSITNHYISKGADGHLYFNDPMAAEDNQWQTTVVNDVTYHYPAYHHFDKKKAQDMATGIKMLRAEWGLEPINITYFFADTKDEIDHYRGFDYTIAMGNRDKPSGMSDGVDNIIYCAGWGENYFHEVVHIYLNRLNPQSPLNEGLAVMYGGSLGHDLHWHLGRLNIFLQQHPEVSLEHPEQFYYLDNYTNPYSAMLGMLCLITYQKDGVSGLWRVLAYNTLDEVMTKEFGVESGGWDKWLRGKIEEMGK